MNSFIAWIGGKKLLRKEIVKGFQKKASHGMWRSLAELDGFF